MNHESSSWSQYEKLVLDRLATLDTGYRKLHCELENLRIDIVKIQMNVSQRATVIGFFGGLLPSIAALIYVLLGK